MRLRRSALPLLAAVPALVLAGSASARPRHATKAHKHATTVRVEAKDFSFHLSRAAVPSGTVTFVIEDVGKAPHNFAIAGHTSKTIVPGKKTTLRVTLAKARRYPYRCTVDSHAELGMKGVLRVTA